MSASPIKRLPGERFWLKRWFIAAAALIAVALAGVVLLVTSNVDFDTFLDYFALGLLVFVAVTLFYGIIAVHDVPYEIARHRNHPHQDAIHAAGWVSLFTLHAIWPFLWIWAMLYRPERGWGFSGPAGHHERAASEAGAGQPVTVEELSRRVAELEKSMGRGGR